MNSTHSIHALVRLLKSPTDPPSPSGPSKIEIACLSWSDPSFSAANKGEVIGEWMLTLLGQAIKTRREKDANSAFDPITDPRYWNLLSSVLTTPPPTTARPTKTWLLPLLHRLQLDTVVIELLALPSIQVLAPARAALAVLWPLAEKKIGVDALGECINAVFDACTKWDHVDDNLSWICSVILASYRNALANAGNKKKLYNSFLTTHISSWLCAIRVSPSLLSSFPMKQLQDSIYAAGTDTLFSLDALKQTLDTLFDALSSSASLISSLLPVLPKIFTSFLSAIHRHRSALFSAVSAIDGKEEVRSRSMEFVNRCWSQIWSSASLQEEFEVEKWKSVIGVFEIVQKERLFAVHSICGMQKDATNGGYEEEVALREARDKAVETLESVSTSFKDHRAELLVLSTQLLDVLVQIEYDFIGSILERVLSALINIPTSLSHLLRMPSSELLTHVLEYHAKTRTVHTYALALLGAVVANSASSIPWSFSSPSMISIFPIAYHLSALAHALRTSLAPTQTTPLVMAVLQTVENAWTVFQSANQEERATKKQKIIEDTDKSGREPRSMLVYARAFSYTCCIAGTILSNLPANAYTKDEGSSLEHLWDNVGNLGWTIIWDCLGGDPRESGKHGTVKGRDGKKRKLAAETTLSAPFPHAVTSAALRFQYDVRSRLSFLLGDCDRLKETQTRKLLDVARHETSEPELVLQIIRTLLWYDWYIHNREPQKQTEPHPIFTVALDILVNHPLPNSKWCGVSAALTHENLGLAILYLLTNRWIDVFDALASAEDLERLISVLFDVSLDPLDENTRECSDATYLRQNHNHTVITLHGIVLDLFRNAQFWELHNIRAVFLSSALTLTTSLSHHFPAATVEAPTTVDEDKLTVACNTFRLLHFVPSEYFIRPVRGELIKRAMAADIQICTKLGHTNGQRKRVKNKDTDEGTSGVRGNTHTEESDDRVPAEDLKNWSDRLTSVRVFLQRMGRTLNTSNHITSSAFVNHLLSPPSCIFSPPNTLTTVTLDLIQSHAVSLLRSQEPEAAASFSNVVSSLIAVRPFSQPDSQETWMHTIVQTSILKLVQHLTSDFDPASLPDVVKRASKTFLEALESALLPHAQRLVERDATELDQFLSSERLGAWSRTLSLRRWLGMNFQVAPISLGLKLATLMICSKSSANLNSETCSIVLELLFEELWCIPDVSHRTHLDVLVSFYAVNGGERHSDEEHVMDAYISQASKKLTVDDFSYLLDILAEGIGGSGLQASQRERLIHLGKVMLHDAPQGTLRVIQNFATRCFALFNDREEIHGGSSRLKAQWLEFIAKHCSDRPAAVRSVDLGTIWTLLHKILTGSSEHDDTTMFPIFHHIVAIVSALVRLRRDIVVHTLPHLGLVLRQLMMLTRKIRPQLGAKQSKIVTDTLPSWLSASQPLSTVEARALARLLTSLTTKTVPRTHAYAHPSTSTESQKAESLAKPFAKHASYVLVAYVDAFNDPLCIMNAEMRRDLEPGLFALCEMVGEHSRDALMVSVLDSGGKTIIKSLWREYEKQRYVGKG